MYLLMNEWWMPKLKKKKLIEPSWIGVNISDSSEGRDDPFSIISAFITSTVTYRRHSILVLGTGPET